MTTITLLKPDKIELNLIHALIKDKDHEDI